VLPVQPTAASTPHRKAVEGDTAVPTPATAALPKEAPPSAHAVKMLRIEQLALDYASRTAGASWSVRTVDVDADDGTPTGRNYKAGRAPRGKGEALQAASTFALTEEELATAGVELPEPQLKEWRPQEYGGAELVGLLKQLRVDVVFTCPCAPQKNVKIGSLAAHRKGKGCQSYFEARGGMESARAAAVTQMLNPAVQAARARTDAASVLNISAVLARAVNCGLPSETPAVLAAAPTPAVCSGLSPAASQPNDATRSNYSGAFRRAVAKGKATKHQTWLEDKLRERRERETREASEREAECEAKREAKRQRRKAARCAAREAAEEAMTLDKLLQRDHERRAKRAATTKVLSRLQRQCNGRAGANV